MNRDDEQNEIDDEPEQSDTQNTSEDHTDDTPLLESGLPDGSEETDVSTQEKHDEYSHVSKPAFNLNKYFLYTLVGGLVISALISVVAVLIGEFNSTVSRALGTTISMVIHTLVALLLVSLNTKSEKPSGSFLINTLIFVTVASFITSILAIWNIITGQIIGDLYAIYFYTFFASAWSRLLLRVGENLLDKPTRLISRTAVGFTALLYALSIPSTLTHYPATLPDFYYRAMAAAAILLATTSVLTTVFHRIYIFKHPEVKSLPSVKSGWDIILAFIVLFLGLPFIFGILVSLSARNATDNYERYKSSSYSETEDDLPDQETEKVSQGKDYPYLTTASERYVPNGTTLLDKMNNGQASNARMACDLVDDEKLHSDGVFYEFQSFSQHMQSATLSTRGISDLSDYMDDFQVSYTQETTLYDNDCKKITPSNFKENDVVTLYFSKENGSVITDVVAVQKIN